MNFNDIKKAIKKNSIKTISDDLYIKRLKSLVIGEGMLHEGNIYLIDFAIKNMPKNGVVVEIGSYGGLSTSLILHLLKKYSRTESMLNCDPWIYEGYNDHLDGNTITIDGREDVSRIDYSEYLKNAFLQNMKFLNNERLPRSFQLTSDDFFNKYDKQLVEVDLFGEQVKLGELISFAYIDGNHALEFVKRDFINVDKHLIKSGYILFDDSHDDLTFGSAVFMEEMKKNKNYELVQKNPNYLFKKV